MSTILKNKKIKIFFLVFCCVVIILAVLLTSMSIISNRDNAAAVKINNDTISVAEMKFAMKQKRSDVISLFTSKYNASYDNKFWNTEFGGETPMEYLRQTALEYLTEIKIQQSLFRQYGLQDDISFKALQSEYQSVNVSRSGQAASGNVVYGNTSFADISSYFNYKFSNLVLAVKEKLGAQGEPLEATDETLKKFYNDKKDELYKNTDNYKVKIYSVIYYVEGNAGTITEADAKAALQKVYNSVKAGKSISDKAVEVSEINLDAENGGSFAKSEPITYDYAIKLKAGETSQIFKSNDTYRFAVCLERKDGGYLEFDSNKQLIKMQYTQRAYKDYISKKVETAKVEKTGAFDNIKIK